MIELSGTEFHRVIPLFEAIDHSRAIVFAVLEQNSAGRVFVDVPERPTVALLWAAEAFSFIAGDPRSPVLPQELAPLLFEQLVPETEDQELVLFAFSASWRQTLDGLLRDRGTIEIHRKVFRFNPEKFDVHRGWRARLPDGLCMRRIDAQLAEHTPRYAPVVDPKSRRLGVCLMRGEDIVSECTAIFVGRGEAEIDIHTAEGQRGKGYATLTASALIEACLEQGLLPQWSCWPERHASRALARNLGFEELPDLPVHYWARDL